MNFRTRYFQDKVIDLVNKFDDLPFEVRRLVLESVMRLLERKADEAIIEERKTATIDIDTLVIPNEEMSNGITENLSENKLGELSE